MPIANPVCNPTSDPTCYTSEVPTSDRNVIGFNQFARVAHRTSENSVLTRLLVYCKRIELRNRQMKEMFRTRYVGKSTELTCSLSAHHSPWNSPSSSTQKLSEPQNWGIFMEASSHRDAQSLTQVPAPFWRTGCGVQSFKLLIMSWSSSDISPARSPLRATS